MAGDVAARLREQHADYTKPNNWPEEKEEICDPELWLEAAGAIEEARRLIGQAIIEYDEDLLQQAYEVLNRKKEGP